MKNLIVTITLALSFLTVLLLLMGKKDTVVETVIEDKDTICLEDKITLRYETKDFVFYEPSIERVQLQVNSERDSLVYAGLSRALVVAAAYTEKYGWKEFSHKLIAGDHVVDGKLYEGYDCQENTGAFIYANRHWSFTNQNIAEAMLDAALYKNSCAFQQTMLVHQNRLIDIPSKLSVTKTVRRALCDYQNRLVVIDSKNELTLGQFASKLQEEGVYSALYLDIGDQSYSLWREYPDSTMLAIHPASDSTRYATNYLVFHWVD